MMLWQFNLLKCLVQFMKSNTVLTVELDLKFEHIHFRLICHVMHNFRRTCEFNSLDTKEK